MGKKYDVVCSIGQYTNQQGETKSQWLNCGAILETKSGGHVLKLTAIPTMTVDQDGNDAPFTGWFQLFEPRAKESKPEKPAPHSNQSGGVMPGDDFADDIPFADPYRFNSLVM